MVEPGPAAAGTRGSDASEQVTLLSPCALMTVQESGHTDQIAPQFRSLGPGPVTVLQAAAKCERMKPAV